MSADFQPRYIVGDIQMGAPGDDIVEGYQTLIEKRLSEITQK